HQELGTNALLAQRRQNAHPHVEDLRGEFEVFVKVAKAKFAIGLARVQRALVEVFRLGDSAKMHMGVDEEGLGEIEKFLRVVLGVVERAGDGVGDDVLSELSTNRTNVHQM